MTFDGVEAFLKAPASGSPWNFLMCLVWLYLAKSWDESEERSGRRILVAFALFAAAFRFLRAFA